MDLIYIGIGILVGMFLVSFRKPRPHKHQWITTSSNVYTRSYLSGTKQVITLLLQRCTCSDHRTSELEGRWTREELGIDDKTVKDLLAMLNEIDNETLP